MSSAAGPFVFNLYLQGKDTIYWLIRNVQLVDNDHQITRGYNFYFPNDVILDSRSIGRLTFGYTLDESPLTLPPDNIDFGVFSVDPRHIAPHDDSDDLEPLKDIFPEGTKLPPIENEDKYDYPFEDHIMREMPNLDLISRRYPPREGFAGDKNACVPAAFSNSMMWLRDSNQLVRDTLDKHFGDPFMADDADEDELEEVDKEQKKKVHRGVFEEASGLMERKDEKGVWMDEFIRGKQDFMDKYKLPVKVKFQSMRVLDEKIFPDENKYGHYAENQNREPPDTAPNAKLDIEWLWNELENDEDVEMNVYCFEVDAEGNLVRDENGEPRTTMEHCVTVIGMYSDHGKYHRVHIQDDLAQEIVGGTRADDWSVIVEGPEADKHVRGMLRLNNIQRENERCYIMQMVSESVDPAIEFDEIPPEAEQEEYFDHDPLDRYWPSSNLLEDVFKDKKRIPPWAWAVPPVLGGTAYLLLNEDDDSDDPIEPMTENDALNLDCMGSGSINVLNNDTGNGLELTDIDVLGDGMVTFDPSGLITVEMANSALTITYSARDIDGRVITGTLFVTVIPSSIDAIDDNYLIDQGATLNENVLSNDLGTELSVTDNTDPSRGSLSLSGSGQFTFIPEMSFTGTTTFTYTIEGKCGSSDMGQVTITVRDTSCVITVSETITSELCASENGEIQIKVEPSGSYEFSWSNGASSQNIDNLTEGRYSVTVLDPETNCAESFEFSVEREFLDDFISNTNITPVRCPDKGEIELELQTPGSGPFNIGVVGPSGSVEFDFDQTRLSLSDFMEIIPGDYTITIYDESLGDICTQEIRLTVEDESQPINLSDDVFNYTVGDTLKGNVLVNDNGPQLTVIDFGTPLEGSATIGADGALIYNYDGTFTGQIEFIYVVRDACDRVDTATIIINIQSEDCDFVVEFSVENADCGKQNGRLTAIPEPQGEYTYEWSNGDTTETTEDLAAGSYSVRVYSMEDSCEAVFSAQVGADTVKLAGVDDKYSVIYGAPLMANVLGNDEGICLAIEDHSEVSQGQLNLTTNGDLMYISEGPFTGKVTFDYVVKDSCGQKDTATVEITVQENNCNFSFEVVTTDAMCGQNDGVAIPEVEGVDDYSIEWSTGDTTNVLDSLTDGVYYVTIWNEDSCYLIRGFEIKNVAQEIADTVLTENVDCNGPGEITIRIDTSRYDTFYLKVVGPQNTIDTVVSGQEINIHDWQTVDTGTYIITLVESGFPDSCAQEIEVEIDQDSAEFEIIIDVENAFCGAATGSAMVRISPLGNYSYLWSTGETTREIEGLAAGKYNIEVTDEDSGCSKEKEFEVENDFVSEFVADQDVRPQTCELSGDIILELITPASGDMRITGNGPGVIVDITVPPGTVRFSDYFFVNAGTYRLNIWDEGVGAMCIERVNITVPGSNEDINLEVIEIQEPSGPTAPDGSITCLIDATPFAPDYQIFLNGALWGFTTSAEFTIGNLTVGSYAIYVVSANGCESNEVVVEFDRLPLTFRVPSSLYPIIAPVRPSWFDPGPGQYGVASLVGHQGFSASWSLASNWEIGTGVRLYDLENRQISLGGGYSWHKGKWRLHGGTYWHWTDDHGHTATLNSLIRHHFMNRFSSNLGISVDPYNHWNLYINGDVNWRF